MPPTTSRIRNRAVCASWLAWMEKQGRARITVYQYGNKCEEFLAFVGEKPLALVTLGDMEKWVARPRQRRGGGNLGADATRAKDVIVLRGLFDHAVKHGHLTTNIAASLTMPTVRNHSPKAIPEATWIHVWNHAAMRPEERVAFGLGFFCGLRREEICRLEPRHVDVKSGALREFKRKGDRNSRVTGLTPYLSCARLFGEKLPQLIGVPETFLDPLHDLLAARVDAQWLIPWGEASVAAGRHRGVTGIGAPDGMTAPDQLNARLLRLLRRCGLPDRIFSPHALRHSFVTYTLRAGVPLQVVSKLANHSSLDITLRYVRLAEDPLAEYLTQHDTLPLGGKRWG